jgi:hypothetical protein
MKRQYKYYKYCSAFVHTNSPALTSDQQKYRKDSLENKKKVSNYPYNHKLQSNWTHSDHCTTKTRLKAIQSITPDKPQKRHTYYVLFCDGFKVQVDR